MFLWFPRKPATSVFEYDDSTSGCSLTPHHYYRWNALPFVLICAFRLWRRLRYRIEICIDVSVGDDISFIRFDVIGPVSLSARLH